MKRGHACRQTGFTLIETLVYLALYSVISLGMLTAVYSLLESGAQNETIAMVEEEGDYLTGKIDASLAGAASIESPTTSGTTLSVLGSDGSTVVIKSLASDILLQEGNTAFQKLNNSNVTVSDLIFLHTPAIGSGSPAESVSASFTLSATTSDGHVLSRDFLTLKYLQI